MMNTLEKSFKTYIDGLKDFLSKKKFKKSGTSFLLPIKKNWAIINIQKSRESTALRIKFTINIGVVLHSLSSFYEEDTGHYPTIDDAHWVKRIGLFLPVPTELWFEIKGNTDINKVIGNTISIIDENVLPKLGKICTDSGLEEIWLENNDSQVTEFQRLMNLSILLKLRSSPDASKVIQELMKYAERKKIDIQDHIQKLNQFQ